MNKRLETMGLLARKRLATLKRHGRATVTIAIGILSTKPRTKSSPQKAHILFASDSQSTYGGAKRANQKIAEIKFQNGNVLVAQAGLVEYGDKVIEIMEKKAAGMKLESPETAADTALEAFRELRNHLIGWHRISEDNQSRFFYENPLDLLVGCFFQNKPYLHKMSLGQGVSTRIKSYDAIGCGRDLGHLLLTEYSKVDPDFQFDEVIAASVVDKVIAHVDGCGHPVWIGGVLPGYQSEGESVTFIYPTFISEGIVEQINKHESELLNQRREKIIKALQSVWGWMAEDEEIEAFRDRFGIKKPKKTKPS